MVRQTGEIKQAKSQAVEGRPENEGYVRQLSSRGETKDKSEATRDRDRGGHGDNAMAGR
jgi:hypothetical protein